MSICERRRSSLWLILSVCAILFGQPFHAIATEPGDLNADEGSTITEGPTFGGNQLWTDELVFHEWRIQRHAWTGHYRLLDEENNRRAWGDFEHCRQRLDELKRELKLAPMSGRVVILLHGLVRSRQSMTGLGDYLKRHSEFTIVNVSYASSRNEVGDHARALAQVIEHLGPEVSEINFVAHSLGNLVLRHYLGDQTDPVHGKRPDPRINRIVMLAPPNNGAQIAERFRDYTVFKTFWGTSGLELANEWAQLTPHLATPESEFGIIAGTRGETSGNNPLLTGVDDFVVRLDETTLPGARDFLIVPALHGVIMDDPQVQTATLRFLWHGYFLTAKERNPIPRVEQTTNGPERQP